MNLTCCTNCGAWHDPANKTPPPDGHEVVVQDRFVRAEGGEKFEPFGTLSTKDGISTARIQAVGTLPDSEIELYVKTVGFRGSVPL